MGLQGIQGSEGLIGPEGPEGPRGSQGIPGTSGSGIRDPPLALTGEAIQARIDAAARPGADAVVNLPAGKIELSAALEVHSGVRLIGRGSHNTNSRPGTMFVPADGYDGPAIVTREFWHHGALKDFRVHGFRANGVDILGGMGENAVIDGVASYANAGHGFFLGKPGGTPVHLGRNSAHGNGGAGLYLRGQKHSLVQILYMAGDNNGESLITVNGGSTSSNVQILGWKSERWQPSSGTPGHPDVILLHNLNGGIVTLGQGRVFVGGGIADSPGAIIRQTFDEGNSIGYVEALVTFQTFSGTYAAGYKDEKTGFTVSVDDLTRKRFSTITQLSANPFGNVLSLSNLPTRDPGKAGSVWNDGGTLKVSP